LAFGIEEPALPVSGLSLGGLFYILSFRSADVAKIGYYPLPGAPFTAVRFDQLPIYVLIFTFTWAATL
jgi:hypothetical protein